VQPIFGEPCIFNKKFTDEDFFWMVYIYIYVWKGEQIFLPIDKLIIFKWLWLFCGYINNYDLTSIIWKYKNIVFIFFTQNIVYC
jgi:hypothetical protein